MYFIFSFLKQLQVGICLTVCLLVRRLHLHLSLLAAILYAKPCVGNISRARVALNFEAPIVVNLLPLPQHARRYRGELNLSVEFRPPFSELDSLMGLLVVEIYHRLVVQEKWSAVGVCQGAHVGRDALGQRRDCAQLDVITTFEHTDEPSFAELIRDFLQAFSQPLIVKFVDCRVSWGVDMVLLVRVKACRAKNDVWLEVNQPWEHLLGKLLAPVL